MCASFCDYNNIIISKPQNHPWFLFLPRALSNTSADLVGLSLKCYLKSDPFLPPSPLRPSCLAMLPQGHPVSTFALQQPAILVFVWLSPRPE